MVTDQPQGNVTIIAGPTASGKSALAIDYALHHNGIIINADSQQLYQSLPILTAQPTNHDQQICSHSLYGMLGNDDYMSAAKWATEAVREIKTAWENGQLPLLVGGTGFYLKALIDGFSPIPDVPLPVRDYWSHEFETQGAEKFYADLERDDPRSAEKLHPHDKQRLIRAREVFEHTKISITDWQEKDPIHILPEAIFDIHLIIPEREQLYVRCNQRIFHMMDQGVMNEVMVLYGDLTDPLAPVTKALGYKELLAYGLGQSSRDQAIESAAQMTRNYAKRQTTWFRNQIKIQKNVADVRHFV
jgi:tRNA dimethylallyltransferase